MRRHAALLVLLFLSTALPGQEKRFQIRSFDVDPFEMRAKTNPVYDNNHQPAAMISLFFSAEDSIEFKGNILGTPQHTTGEWIVYMPAGSKWIEISAEGYETLHFDFPADKELLPAHGYLLKLGISRTAPLRTLVLSTFSCNRSQTSYGLMLGICKKNGGYVHAGSDFHFGLHTDSGVTEPSESSQHWYTGISEKSRFSLTAGYLRKVFDPLYLYAGAGYGRRVLAWEMYSHPQGHTFAKIQPYSFDGAEFECGLIGRIGIFAISLGVQTIQFNYYEARAGIGVLF